MKKVIMYSTGCPKCKILKAKLDATSIEYDICSDTNEMEKKGIVSMPMLEVDSTLYTYGEAVKLINGGELL